FTAFSLDGMHERTLLLRELYNKYHSRGLEIYQVSADTNEHFWKEQTAALPWISVYAGDNIDTVFGMYNVQMVPTFFLLGKDTNVYKRDVQIKNLDAEIQSLL
ncbi:MAG: peroxiredoxin family protein, partial [Prevotella sp.]